MMKFILSVILAAIVIFAITIAMVYIAVEIRDFFYKEGHYKEKEGGDQ